MKANAAVNTYRQQQEALELQRKEEEVRERLKDFDFIRALYEMVNPGVKR